MSDSLFCGRRFRILNVIDNAFGALLCNTLPGDGISRECLAAVVDTSLSGDRVARELDRVAEMR